MTNLTVEQQAILLLIQSSLWGVRAKLPAQIDWAKVDVMAKEQAVTAFVYDGAIKMEATVPEELLAKWKMKMLQGVVHNERLLHAQDELIAWFDQAGIPVVILKGSSVARYYPQPDLRILGDIDILIDEANLDRAQQILEQKGYVAKESDHGFHISFSRERVYVELHYNVTGFPDSEGGQIAKKETEHFLEEISRSKIYRHVFPVLGEKDQGLSLLLHMIRHMFECGIGLRQVCDWAMYAENGDPEYFATVVVPMLKRCGLYQYARVATRACVCYLGLPNEHLSWCADVADEVCRQFIDEVFREGNMGDANKEGMGSLFTHSDSMGEKKSAFFALISRLTELSYKNFPVSQKLKVLLPFFWFYLPVRYLVRSELGLRPKKSIAKVVQSAKQQRTLYEQLSPFTSQKDETIIEKVED